MYTLSRPRRQDSSKTKYTIGRFFKFPTKRQIGASVGRWSRIVNSKIYLMHVHVLTGNRENLHICTPIHLRHKILSVCPRKMFGSLLERNRCLLLIFFLTSCLRVWNDGRHTRLEILRRGKIRQCSCWFVTMAEIGILRRNFVWLFGRGTTKPFPTIK